MSQLLVRLGNCYSALKPAKFKVKRMGRKNFSNGLSGIKWKKKALTLSYIPWVPYICYKFKEYIKYCRQHSNLVIYYPHANAITDCSIIHFSILYGQLLLYTCKISNSLNGQLAISLMLLQNKFLDQKQ